MRIDPSDPVVRRNLLRVARRQRVLRTAWVVLGALLVLSGLVLVAPGVGRAPQPVVAVLAVVSLVAGGAALVRHGLRAGGDLSPATRALAADDWRARRLKP